jgi:hypothetical protein
MDLKRKRSPTKARAYKVAGWSLVVGTFVAIPWIPSPFLMAVPLYVGHLLARQGKKHSVEPGEQYLKNDSRPPVIYLRSFADETAEGGAMARFSKMGSKDLAKTVPPNSVQEQDALGYVFRKVGPYLALGKPGENLPELGSYKLYAANEEWQNTIRDLFQRARLIIFKAGLTDGLRWELKELVESVDAVKVVMLLPARERDYPAFIRWANEIMPSALPERYPPHRIVVFTAAWAPRYLESRNTLTETFAPFFQQNGLAVTESYWEKFIENANLRF